MAEHRFSCRVVSVVKHLLLFVLVNLLAATIILIVDKGVTVLGSGGSVFIIVIFAVFAMVYNIIPYLILLHFLKSKPETSLLKYAIAGAICPAAIIFHLLISAITSEYKTFSFLLVLLLMVIGAACGVLYGFLDKKIQVHKIIRKCDG